MGVGGGTGGENYRREQRGQVEAAAVTTAAAVVCNRAQGISQTSS